jgi:type II restriction/modification system DNA methylase subunit YeeA
VDIQPIATEISKLRIFLSLIIDENIDDTADNRGIIPLPNLEFKFVTANGLIELKQKQIEQATFLCDQTESLQQDLESVRIEFLQATSQKQELKIRFEQLQKEILEKELDDDGFNGGGAINERANQLISWKPFSNKCCEWFDPKWMFGVEGFDIVIGNPPYVQLQKNKSEFGKLYKDKGFETFEGSGDIYVLFYEKSFHLLNQNGISCFITSNKWLRAGYGEKLRRFLLTKTQLIALFDLGADVFESATVDSNILIFGSYQNQPQFSNLEISSLKNTKAKDTDLYEYWEKQKIEINPTEKYDATGKQGWFIGCPAEFSLKRKIEEKGKPLKDWDIKIYRGILTGLNEAFIIDTETKERLCIEDPKSSKIIKPILRGKDINRYGYEWKGLWVINSHNGVKSKKVSRIDVEKDYPAIYNHLQQFENQLIKREDQGDHWSNLRNCAYIEEFEKEKVVYSEIVQEPQFYLDTKGEFYPEATSFLMTGERLRLIMGILYSKAGVYFFKNYYAGGGLGEGFRYKKLFLEQLPIPLLDTLQKQKIAQKIEELVDGILKNKEQKVETKDLEQQIDELVYQLYELTDDEIKVVNNEL